MAHVGVGVQASGYEGLELCRLSVTEVQDTNCTTVADPLNPKP